MQLRNEDILAGRISAGEIKVTTANGQQVNVQGDDIAELTVPEGASVGNVRLKLQNGTTVEGVLVGKTISFQVTPGPKLDVYVGHITQIAQPKLPSAAAATRPAPAPKPKPKPKPKKPKPAPHAPPADPVDPAAPPEDPPAAPPVDEPRAVAPPAPVRPVAEERAAPAE